ncbi:MAG TPA: hypothetical protein VIF09_11660, partial [Polyangiaceae bacterium]
MRLRARPLPFALLVAWPLACGSSNNPGLPPPGDDASTGNDGAAVGDDGGFGDDSSLIQQHKLVALSVAPLQANIQSLNGAPVTQAFQAVAQFDDGSSAPVTGAAWARDNPQVGGIDTSGLYSANGSEGGVVDVTASYQGKTATATLVVKLHLQQNPGGVSGSVQGSLQGASTLDPSVVWAYPYDRTVFPRGIGQAPLMWNNGGASDLYYVHLTSPTFELESFTGAPASRY